MDQTTNLQKEKERARQNKEERELRKSQEIQNALQGKRRNEMMDMINKARGF